MGRHSRIIHEQFEALTANTADAIALVFGQREMSYRELNFRANALATELVRRGVSRGNLVGLCMERSAEVLVGILAMLRAGGAYVPLDPVYPDERLSIMLADTGASIVLVNAPPAERIAALTSQVSILCVTDDA